MSDCGDPDSPGADFEALNPLREDAVRYPGATREGRPCALTDNTGRRLPPAEMKAILEALVAGGAFGLRARSAAGSGALALDPWQATHVQIDGELYRLIVRRHEARIEPF